MERADDGIIIVQNGILGHPKLTAFLGVPFIKEGRAVGMIGVGNREGGYTEREKEILEALIPAILGSLLRKRAEEDLQNYKNLLFLTSRRLPDLERRIGDYDKIFEPHI